MLLVAAGAAAQPATSSDDEVMAAALFRTGRELVAAGDYQAGCPKLEASMQLHPAASTILNVARCHEHEGRIATAWLDYQRGLALNRDTPGVERQKELEKVARDALAALEPRLPKLRIAIVDPPPGLKLSRDGQDLPLATLGEPLPGDPGEHEVVATAPGFRDAKQVVKLVPGQVTEVRIALEKDAPAAAPALLPPAPPPSLTPAAPLAPPSQQPGEGRSGHVPTWAWIAGGVGLAAGVAAVGFRIDEANVDGKQSSLCHGNVQTGCPPVSVYDPSSDNARKDLDRGMSIGLGVAGVAGVGAAVVGIIRAKVMQAKPRVARSIAPSAPRLVPWMGAGSAGAILEGEL